MVGSRAPTEKRLKVEQAWKHEQQMAAAVKRHQTEGLKTDGTHCLTIPVIASLYQVPLSSLGHHMRGHCSVGIWGKTKQWLTEAEEMVLVDHIKQLGCHAIHHGPQFAVGISGVSHFITTHPELSVYQGTKLDRACQNGLNQAALWDFEDAVGKVFEEERPEAGQIFGMD
ncbi:hypothetical protein FRB94_001773 [Tulasnella sp. JGI-2019a]|nr:hypothetical protein FRB94_001773 [Tulasnella sp. JGI-2019a]KAG9023477.1 hypothetical protein FRB95_013056 [Tulasnella sp. JGI-2019a]